MHDLQLHVFCCLPSVCVGRPLVLRPTLDAGHSCVQHLQLVESSFLSADLILLVAFLILSLPTRALTPMHAVGPLFWFYAPHHPLSRDFPRRFSFPFAYACIVWFLLGLSNLSSFPFPCLTLTSCGFIWLFRPCFLSPLHIVLALHGFIDVLFYRLHLH